MSWTTKRYCFDIDGTICTNTWGEYEDAEPFFDRIKIINELYEKGNHIIYFTARGMGRCDGNIACAYSMWYTLSACLSVYLSVSVCMSVCLSVCMSVCLCICLLDFCKCLHTRFSCCFSFRQS